MIYPAIECAYRESFRFEDYQSFQRLFKLGDADAVIQLAEELLRPAGGLLFDGYRSEAPAAWRKSLGEEAV